MSGPILIMAGGTGGHVFPALAVAQALRADAREVVWLGTRRGLEARVVPAAGFPVEWVNVTGLRGKGWGTWLGAPARLAVALVQSLSVMRRRRPAAVLGMGGFVTGAGGVAAWLTRCPLVIHEQNAIAGLSNRLLARLAREVLEAFPGSFPAGQHTRCVGNPVRTDILQLPAPGVRFAERSGCARLLVLGGSLGAQALNERVPEAIARMSADARPEVWHQTGERTLAQAEAAYARAGVAARIVPFIQDMASAYAWADLVLCRSGAITIAELVPQDALDAAALAARLERLLHDRRALLAMAESARRVARPDATTALEQACLAAAGALA